nr:MAG TPA: hypothetical protein [Caudoviricetes sp.]
MSIVHVGDLMIPTSIFIPIVVRIGISQSFFLLNKGW